jgi:2-polyprenyl-3-methyl-5-hydroxy-6-metoxy-1,4-benzoquinol methylase
MLNLEPRSIEWWLAELRVAFLASAPELLSLFDTYAAEATFGRRYIANDLQRLQPGAALLEVGAGSMLLSCQLVREGFEVTALEPTGFGFTHFDRMREVILGVAKDQACLPRILASTGEALAETACFDYAFSINVMEHVADVECTLANVGRSLKSSAVYHFTCPNYLFPYEPHFNIPTFFSKRLTYNLLGNKILSRTKIPDPAGLWQSLNWIGVLRVRGMAKRLPGLKITFNNGLLVSTLERIASDSSFAARRSPFARKAILLLVGLRLHRLFGCIPAVLQPIMDCRVEKFSVAENL